MKALSSEPKEPDSGIATNVSWWSSIDKSGVECIRWRKALREQVEKVGRAGGVYYTRNG